MKCKNIPKIVFSWCCLLAIISSCREPLRTPAPQYYTDVLQPVTISIQFPKGSNISPLSMSIDHVNGAIYNEKYLPYGTKLDSAYIVMRLSTECHAVLLNETTGKSKDWQLQDTSKIDISGGKLLLEVSRPGTDKPILKYKLRLLIYGYNPNKITWDVLPSKAPMPTTSGQFFSAKNQLYWLARNVDELALYSVNNISESSYQLINRPDISLRPKTIMVDHQQGVWALSDDDQLFLASETLSSWEKQELGGIRLTEMIYDQEKDLSKPTEWKAIGYDISSPKEYYSYTIKEGKAIKEEKLSVDFPIRNSFVFDYSIAGVVNSNLIGGTNVFGQKNKNVFFSSNGLNWAEIPYRGNGFEAPLEGGLYLRKGNTLYMVGGRFSDGLRSSMYVSHNRGVDWVEITKEEAPGKDFKALSGASGLILTTEGQDAIYIVGGAVQGGASTQVWRGYRDTTGGIINEIHK